MSYWGYGGFGHGRGYGYGGYGYAGYGGYGYGGNYGNGGWTHFGGQRDLPSARGFYSNYQDNWGNDTPYRRANWENSLAQENSVRRSNIAGGLDWNQGHTNNVLRNSFRRLRDEAAVDNVFRRY
jgi:hypothetical protein